MSKCCGACENCKMGISPGWMSPKNVWFPNVVMIRLRKDCPKCSRALSGRVGQLAQAG